MSAAHGSFLFAEAAPLGVNDWLSSFFWLAGGVLVLLKIIDHFKAKPPMGEQVSSLKDWVEEKFASKDAVRGALDVVKGTIDDHEDTAMEYRIGLKNDVKDLDKKLSDRTGAIFDEIRSLGREVSHLEGRLTKSGKLTS